MDKGREALVADRWSLVALGAALAWSVAGCSADARQVDAVDAADGSDSSGDGTGEAAGDDGGADVGADADADGDGDGDVGADADADTAGDGADDGADADAAWSHALVVLTSDYASGGVSLIDPDTVDGTPVVAAGAASVDADAVLVCRGGGDFDVVERLGADRIRRFHAADGAVSETASLALESGVNPQDAALLSTGEIAVPQYERTALAFVAGDLGSVVTTTDLASFADPDGLPEMFRAVEAGDLLFVSLQLLDRSGTYWTPTGPGVLAAIDPATHALHDFDASAAGIQGVTLAGRDPVGPLRVYGPAILVSSVGDYGASDGGIEAVDPATGTSLGFVMSEATLGGDISDWIVLDDNTGFAIVTAAYTSDLLVPFDLDHDTAGAPLLTSGGYTLSGLADLGDGRIAVGDRTTGAAGVRVFDAATGDELTAAPIDVGLPPVAACAAR